MKKVYLLCNAHLDPVWLWQRKEGMAEALSTFRVAADFCEKYDGFVFNHNESVLYEWVEEHEPALFERIKKLVQSGKWVIVGGWYLQPDCNMPSGESFVRQIRVGNAYFKEKFGVKPTLGFNVDPFGHTRGLVQILKKTGYDAYLFMRPGEMESGNFLWEGFDGSQVIGHKIFGGYNTLKGETVKKLEGYLEQCAGEKTGLILWGIGDHGGGASEEDLKALAAFRKEHPEVEVIDGGYQEYFRQIDKDSLRLVDTSLVHTMVGCYSSMCRIKQKHRELENALAVCERMLAHSGISYDRRELEQAEKALLCCEFHDILPGTMIQPSEEDSLRQMGYAGEIIDRLTQKAFFALCGGQRCGKRGEIPILVYNPHPYEVETDIEAEFQLENQNWNDGEYTVARVYSDKDGFLPSQNEKEDCNLNLDWRKRVVFHAKLAPMAMNRFDCQLETLQDYRFVAPYTQDETGILFESEEIKVHVDKRTGLIDSYQMDGVERLSAPSGRLEVYRDNEDPWGMRVDSFADKAGEFHLLCQKEAQEFAGCSNIEVTENGAVRMKVQAIFGYGRSYAVVVYTFSRFLSCFDVDITLFSNDRNVAVKYAFTPLLEKAAFIGQTAFGTQVLETGDKEITFQKWCALNGQNGAFAMMNKGIYAGSSDGNSIRVTLLRTPGYSVHPIKERPLVRDDRFLPHIDMGMRKFSLRMVPSLDKIDQMAQEYNEEAPALSFFPSGEGERPAQMLQVSNPNVILSALYSVEPGKYLIRLYHARDCEGEAEIAFMGIRHRLTFGKFEVKTLLADQKTVTQCDMLGTPLGV